MAIEPQDPDRDEIIKLYLSGKSVLSIAKRFGRSRSWVYARLRGVELRNASEAAALRSDRHYLKKVHAANRERCSKMSLEERRAMVAPALEARASMSSSDRDEMIAKRLRSRARTRNQTIGTGEAEVAEILDSLGEVAEAQWHAGPYNIDFALPNENIAVEVEAGGKAFARSGTKSRYFKRRTENLMEAGWKIIFVTFRTPARGLAWKRVHDELRSYLELMRRQKPGIGCYGVIRCDKYTSTPGGFKGKNWTRVRTPEDRLD